MAKKVELSAKETKEVEGFVCVLGKIMDDRRKKLSVLSTVYFLGIPDSKIVKNEIMKHCRGKFKISFRSDEVVVRDLRTFEKETCRS